MARDFDGTTSVISGTVTAIDTGDWTIIGWVNLDGAGESSSGRFLTVSNGSSEVHAFLNADASRHMRCNALYTGGVGPATTTTNEALSTGTWYCVAGTFSASDKKCRIYYGTQSAAMAECTYSSQVAAGTTRTTGATTAYVGNNNAATRTHDGRISHIGYLPWGMTVAEMEQFRLGDLTALYVHGTPRLVALLDSPDNTAVPDLSGNGVALTATSTAVAEGPPVGMRWGTGGPTSVLAVASGSSATVTPGTVTVAASVGAPTVAATATVTPGTVTVSASLGAPTVTTTATPTPSTVAVAASVSAPTVATATTVTPGAVTVVVEVPAAAADTGAALVVVARTYRLDARRTYLLEARTLRPLDARRTYRRR